MIFGMRYMVQMDQKLINLKKRKVKGMNLTKDNVKVIGTLIMVKESDTDVPMASSYLEMGL